MDKWKALFASRKFWASIITVIAIICNKVFGFDIPEETVLLVVITVVGWILGQAVVDASGNGSP